VQSAKADQHGHDRVRLRHARESASKVKRNAIDAMRIGTTCKHLHPKARVYSAVQRLLNGEVREAMEHDHEEEVHGNSVRLRDFSQQTKFNQQILWEALNVEKDIGHTNNAMREGRLTLQRAATGETESGERRRGTACAGAAAMRRMLQFYTE
jgi:hypothetical protein